MHTSPDTRHCASDAHCRYYNRTAGTPAPAGRTPLCDGCLDAASRDIPRLLYDYIDLEQLQAPTLSQALNMQPAGKSAPPMPLKGEPEALQAEIAYTLTMWEEIIRDVCQLSPMPDVRRGGPNVQRALGILTPRLDVLANQPPTTVYPNGPEGAPQDIAGWEAVHQMQRLHHRARGMLGRTHRTTHLPGTCSTCGLDQLHRDDPRHPEDPCDVYCQECGTTWPHDDYQTYVTQLVWPTRTGAAA
ncbi:hypothetical protein ACIBCR_15025 [Micromonospora echinospora]|uniref:hypothetical protein n=1 Tax=Micromonospora echinospora TaxID=1877 RepID=UPI0037964C82